MIEVITGLPGFGKTATVTAWALRAMANGKTVYSNFHIKGAIYVRDPRELLGRPDIKNALIICDEMGILFDQLTMYSIDHNVWVELRQHRKDGIDILGTAQSIHDIAYPMRRLIQFEYNIYMKLFRFAIANCRNPQPRGEGYGKRIYYLSKRVFDSYDTNQKVLQDEDNLSSEDIVYTPPEAKLQRDMLLEAFDIVSSNAISVKSL